MVRYRESDLHHFSEADEFLLLFSHSIKARQDHQPGEVEEVRRLKRELEIVKQERDILKKALGIFSRSPQ
jgi:transposase-like protein